MEARNVTEMKAPFDHMHVYFCELCVIAYLAENLRNENLRSFPHTQRMTYSDGRLRQST